MTPYIATEVTIGGYVVERDIARYIQEASLSTGVNLRYLLAKAGQESSFSANARAGGTSATGIYQFTKVTWFELFMKNGAKYGYPSLAKKVSYSKRYGYRVKDPRARKKILSLRLDPRMSALLAAEYARSNQIFIEKNMKRSANSTDLYLSHFMGPVGAVTLLKAKADTPNKYAYEIFPQAAKANPRIFYKKSRKRKNPRTVSEVYNLIDRIFNKAISRFSNLPADVFIKIPQVIPSVKPSGDWFADYALTSNKEVNFYNGFNEGNSVAEMLYRENLIITKDVVDLDSVASNTSVFSGADVADNYDEAIDIEDLYIEMDLDTSDLFNLQVVSNYDDGVNLDEVDSEMLDPVFQVNRTFFSSEQKIKTVVSGADYMEEVSLSPYVWAQKQKQNADFRLAMLNADKEANFDKLLFESNNANALYKITAEDAASVKNILSSLSLAPMAEPLINQAMNTLNGDSVSGNYISVINSKLSFDVSKKEIDYKKYSL
jgi:hypothetical protein